MMRLSPDDGAPQLNDDDDDDYDDDDDGDDGDDDHGDDGDDDGGDDDDTKRFCELYSDYSVECRPCMPSSSRLRKLNRCH